MQAEKKVRKVTKKTVKQIETETEMEMKPETESSIIQTNSDSVESNSKTTKKQPKEPKPPKEPKQPKQPKESKPVKESKEPDGENGEELQEQKIPKKRGRKPKGGKIIKQTPASDDVEHSKPNIILHLKCSMSDIKDKIFPLDEEAYNPVITESIDGYAFNSSKDMLTFDYIKQQSDSKQTDDVVYFQKSKDTPNPYSSAITESLSAMNPQHQQPSQFAAETDSVKDIWKKLSELEHCLHNNDISDKKSACFWCTCDFDNPPIFIPKYELNNSYHVYGCFCSPECATAYLMKENIDQASKVERYALLNHIYCKIYLYEKNIKPAPSPFYILNKYYGNLTIQEYRKLLKNERLLLIVDKPLTRQLPELHQDNDDFIINTNTIPSASKYKIKRASKQSKNSIVSENFGVK